jgi:hypothetical protein
MRLNLGPGRQPVIGVSPGHDAGRLPGVATSSAPHSPYRRTRAPPGAGFFTGTQPGARGSVRRDAGGGRSIVRHTAACGDTRTSAPMCETNRPGSAGTMARCHKSDFSTPRRSTSRPSRDSCATLTTARHACTAWSLISSIRCDEAALPWRSRKPHWLPWNNSRSTGRGSSSAPAPPSGLSPKPSERVCLCGSCAWTGPWRGRRFRPDPGSPSSLRWSRRWNRLVHCSMTRRDAQACLRRSSTFPCRKRGWLSSRGTLTGTYGRSQMPLVPLPMVLTWSSWRRPA